jgi:hypothetical protein
MENTRPSGKGFLTCTPADRAAQGFDLAGINITVGAPSFAFFAKGGSWKCLRWCAGHAA